MAENMRGSSTASIESAIEFLNLLPQNNSQKTVFVCNGCCCGHVEKGNPRVNNMLFMQLLNGQKNVTMEQPYCLGPCSNANVVKVNVKSGTGSKNYWFREINSDDDVKDVVEFVKNPSEVPAALKHKQMWFG